MAGGLRLRAAAALLAALGIAGCSATTGPSPAPSASSTPSPKPVTVDTVAAATTAAASWLKGSGYKIVSATGGTVKFRDEESTYTSKVSCEGGPTHGIGWYGICQAPSEDAFSVVVAVSITTGAPAPKVATNAMDADTAAYCGDDTTPAWVKTTLQKAAGQYCYLKNEDG